MTRPRGRPQVNRATLQVRVSPEERQAFEGRAKEVRLTVAEWLRLLARADAGLWTGGGKMRTIEAGQRVCGGSVGSSDYDEGTVTTTIGDHVTVHWDSGATLTQQASILRPIDPADSEADRLICQSIARTETVVTAWSEELAESLGTACEDSVEADGEVQFWGTRDDGETWRVHLKRPASTP